MQQIEKLEISMTSKDFSRLFPSSTNRNERVIKYNRIRNKHDDDLPARFLEVVRCSKQIKYPSYKDTEFWNDYCKWCDIVHSRVQAYVIVRGDFKCKN